MGVVIGRACALPARARPRAGVTVGVALLAIELEVQASFEIRAAAAVQDFVPVFVEREVRQKLAS